MRMRQLTSRQPLPETRVTPPERKPDPEVSLGHDDSFARAWEFEYGKPNFDAENKNATPPSATEIPVKSDLSSEETRNNLGTAQERPPEIFLQTEVFCDLTYTYPYMEPNLETSSKQPSKTPTNPRSSKCKLPHNPKPNCNDDNR